MRKIKPQHRDPLDAVRRDAEVRQFQLAHLVEREWRCHEARDWYARRGMRLTSPPRRWFKAKRPQPCTRCASMTWAIHRTHGPRCLVHGDA